MSDMKISPLGGMYVQEAVRQLVRPYPLWRMLWRDSVADSLAWASAWVLRNLKPDGTGFLTFPESWMASHHAIPSKLLLFGRAHVDPFRMDVFDCLVILASNDEDLTQDKNHRGPNKKWSAETRRLLSQIRSCGRVSTADIDTMMEIAKAHLPQIAGHVASLRRADAAGVLAILQQRSTQPGFKMSLRLKGALDNSFDFRRANYIWSTSNTIRVHAPGRSRQKPFEDFYYHLRDAGDFPGFYTRANGLVDEYAHRVINGKREVYEALRFPADPVVAQSLIAIAEDEKERLAVNMVVDVTTKRLADHVPGRPLLLGDNDPGRILVDDNHQRHEDVRVDGYVDLNDDPGFRR
jgi:hypothetical protein